MSTQVSTELCITLLPLFDNTQKINSSVRSSNEVKIWILSKSDPIINAHTKQDKNYECIYHSITESHPYIFTTFPNPFLRETSM